MFTLDDMKEWRQDRLKFPPMTGSFVVGGAAVGTFPSLPAVLDGNPEENIRLTVSTASTCNVFDFATYKRGKLHKEYPHMLNFKPFRAGTDTVTIKSVYGGEPMTVYGHAMIPIGIGEDGYTLDAYLVDLVPSIQGFLSVSFLREYDLQLEFTDGMQKLVPAIPSER